MSKNEMSSFSVTDAIFCDTMIEPLAANKERSRLVDLTEDEYAFLCAANDPELRQDLLARLEQLGLLAAFQEAETGTTQ